MRTVAELTTPAALVDVDVLEANIAAMAAHARELGVALRPHFKTHKSLAIARLQLEAGATGFTAATLREAGTLVDAGFDDVLLAHPPVGERRAERLAALLDRAPVTLVLDSDQAAAAAMRLGRPIRCLWEIDSGARRTGTPPGEATVAAIERAAARDGIEIAGLMTFPGHVYQATGEAELDAAVADEQEALGASAAALRPRVLSGGTTPTAWRTRDAGVLTELRPGNYVFHDATQVALGVATTEQCAFTVLATVVARPSADRVVLDAGSKALASDVMNAGTTGYGILAGAPEARVTALYEEHALVAAPGAGLAVGDRVEVIPNHSCAAANLHAAYVMRRGEDVLDVVPLDARGWEPAT